MLIYLNFGGYTGLAYDEHSPVIAVPPAGFPVEDQAEIVQRVAKFFAPFACVVTDKPPVDQSAGKCIVCILGGDESWSGSRTAQTGRIGGWKDKGWNRCYVPHMPTFSHFPAGVAATVAHEIGHVCGLVHYLKDQANKREYLREWPDGTCPIMGAPSDPLKARWSKGINELGQVQDDVAILTSVLGKTQQPFRGRNMQAIEWPRGQNFTNQFTLRNSFGHLVKLAADKLSASFSVAVDNPGLGTFHALAATFEEMGNETDLVTGKAGVYQIGFAASAFGTATKLCVLVSCSIDNVPPVELWIEPVD